ncbi:MAG: hypothetical protein GXP25_21980 [Planctomycetes bacterium]|nr:hypothetical protein [Planctomycetota bacterium]
MRLARIRWQMPALLLAVFAGVSVKADDDAKKAGTGKQQKTVEVSIASLTPAQKLQLKVDALVTLNDVIGAVAKEAKMRAALLDQYLNETGQMEAYLKVREKMPKRPMKSADWVKGRDSDREIPLTFEDAFLIAVEQELEDRGEEIRKSNPKDTDRLERTAKAHLQMAKKRFGETIVEMMEVERKIDFLRSQQQWEKLIVWAKAEVARQKAEKEKQKEKNRKEKIGKKEEARQQQQERAELARQRRIESIERKWQRRTEAYQLRTDRVRAKIGTSYPWTWRPSSGNRWWE